MALSRGERRAATGDGRRRAMGGDDSSRGRRQGRAGGVRFYLYASHEAPLDGLARRLSERLGIAFQERDSDYWGGLYFLARGSDVAELLQLHSNSAGIDGGPVLSDYAEWATLLHVTNPSDPDGLRPLLIAEGFALLRAADR